MESKHPDQLPQTYKCVKCGQGYPRLSNLREHMVSAHGADKARHTGFEYIVNADAVKSATDGSSTGSGGGQTQYTGRYDYVMKDLMSITNGGTLGKGGRIYNLLYGIHHMCVCILNDIGKRKKKLTICYWKLLILLWISVSLTITFKKMRRRP